MQVKKFRLFGILLAIVVLCGCGAGKQQAQSRTIQGEIERIGENSILIEPNDERGIGERLEVVLDEGCEILNLQGEPCTLAQLKTDMYIEVICTGDIREVYPPQTTATKVRVLQPAFDDDDDRNEHEQRPVVQEPIAEEPHDFMTAELVTEVPAEARSIPSDETGEDILLHTEKNLEQVQIFYVQFDEATSDYVSKELVWTSDMWKAGVPLHVRLEYTNEEPAMAISWQDEFGERERRLICLTHLKSGAQIQHVAWLMHYVVPLAPTDITLQMPYHYDMDGDGRKNSISLQPSFAQDGTYTSLHITHEDMVFTKDMGISTEVVCWIADLDKESGAELYISGKDSEGKSRLYVWEFDEGIEQSMPAREDAVRDALGNAALKGQIETIEQTVVYARGTVELFGTHEGQILYSWYHEKLSPMDGLWLFDQAYPMTTKLALLVTMEDGTLRELPAGTKINFYATDAESLMMVELADGGKGLIDLTKTKQGVWQIAEKNAADYFA